jgi:hypothetical protein
MLLSRTFGQATRHPDCRQIALDHSHSQSDTIYAAQWSLQTEGCLQPLHRTYLNNLHFSHNFYTYHNFIIHILTLGSGKLRYTAHTDQTVFYRVQHSPSPRIPQGPLTCYTAAKETQQGLPAANSSAVQLMDSLTICL